MFKSIFNKIYYRYLSKKNPIAYAKKIGVRIGTNNKIVSCRHGMFGSEPYLVQIGNDCLFSGNIQFLTHDGSLHLFRKKIPNAFIYNQVKIGNNVFIGYGVTILPGVTVGDNCIIGAGSIVSRDIPNNSVAAGVPAKVLRDTTSYIDKMYPHLDMIDGFDSKQKKRYLYSKFSLK